MTSQELVQTLLPAKKEKLKFILDWIDTNCNQDQKEEAAQIISEYGDFIITYPNENMLRCAHATELIQPVPTAEQLHNTEEEYEQIMKEIRKRKQLINGLQTEIQELRQL